MEVNEMDQVLKGVISALVYSGVGLLVFVIGFFVVKLILPFDVKKEIEVDQNVSLGVMIGSFILGLSIIIAAAIHG
jgi:putative membrane protein